LTFPKIVEKPLERNL